MSAAFAETEVAATISAAESIFFIRAFLRLSGSVAAKGPIAQRLRRARQPNEGGQNDFRCVLQYDPTKRTGETISAPRYSLGNVTASMRLPSGSLIKAA